MPHNEYTALTEVAYAATKITTHCEEGYRWGDQRGRVADTVNGVWWSRSTRRLLRKRDHVPMTSNADLSLR